MQEQFPNFGFNLRNRFRPAIDKKIKIRLIRPQFDERPMFVIVSSFYSIWQPKRCMQIVTPVRLSSSGETYLFLKSNSVYLFSCHKKKYLKKYKI